MPYVIRRQVVARSLARLRSRKIHTLFAGYLYLLQRSANLGRLEDLQPEFLPYFKEFFLVGNHPLGTPYIKPFTEQKPSERNLWLNENVAGSYAPSSLRADQPFRQVVEIAGKTYSLPPDHAERAYIHLLYSSPVSAADLAVVLYRDVAFLSPDSSIYRLIDTFAYEFGLSDSFGGDANRAFEVLFSVPGEDEWGYDWIEETDAQIPEELVSRGRRLSPSRQSGKIRLLSAEELLNIDSTVSDDAPHFSGILSLEVEGLLSFAERTEFHLGQLNILVGPNGSGKSNLIDFIRVLRAAVIDIQDAFVDSGFEEWLNKQEDRKLSSGLLKVTAVLPDRQDPIVHELRLGPPQVGRARLEESIYSMDLTLEAPLQYFVGSYRSRASLFINGTSGRRREREIARRQYDSYKSVLSQIRDYSQYPEISGLSTLYAGLRIYSEWSFGRNSELREATPTGRSETRLSEQMDDLPLILNGLKNTSGHEKIRVLLHELKETYSDYETRIFFGRVGLELIETFLTTPIPAKRLSDGTLRFLALAAILLQTDLPPVICIEEPELGMHPDMIRMVARMIAEASKKVQVIITTHSEQLLSALQDDFDRLFAFNAGREGSEVRQFSRTDYAEWREDHNLGELWTSGELGGNRW